jgi:NAD(P)H-quinone oxidoreductase subunit 5
MTDLPLLFALLSLAVPGGLALAALVPHGLVRRGLLILTVGAGVAHAPASFVAPDPSVRWLPGVAGELTAIRLDAVSVVVLWLVGTVGAVLWRFSTSYLDGDPRIGRYRRAMLLTLACVTGLLLANHLLVLAACWTGTSIALHQLLTHFGARREAQLAAHKKFLASRLADLCLVGTGVLTWLALGTLSLDRMGPAIATVGATPGLQVAGLLLVICAALKSAQLPFHGWLTQVMEAPTPVSALLHAGVVNMGGVVLLRLSDVLVHLPLAQTVMVVVGTSTAVLAGLVWTTRVSVKVSLAWSTMAQMGFMLLQCGLGAWPVALLHLVAHSLYKAHAFLSTGSTVERTLGARLAPAAPPATMTRWMVAGAAGLAGVAVVGFSLGADPVHEPSLWVLGGIVGLAVAPLMAGARGVAGLARGVAGSLAVAVLYFGWHAVFLPLAPPAPGPWLPLQLAIVAVGFGGGFVLQALLFARPDGAVARAIQPALFAGLYLDAWLTRLTFRVWPPRLARPSPRSSLQLVRTSETR